MRMKLQRIMAILYLMAMISLPVEALEKTPFDEKLFQKMQDEGVPVLVDIYAKWCPTCERQGIILKRYFKENQNSPIQIMVVDYDEQKQWVKHFRAPRQSTLYLYQNHQQKWFSVAETRTHVIEDVLNAYLPKTAVVSP